MMTRRNLLFKHQLTNLIGISYERLTQIIADGDVEVDEDTVHRLCTGLECERGDIIKTPPPAGADRGVV
ncbi:MAG TPA: helix-turn-helix domain-containing protein [Candidatus Latescibacteria bacterium]|jgi:DNA-binding Xre family transcriptional regulator|nr:helix-turn-helix domain-containing protein [Candidatus Latescibacterota bacterium]HJP31943.1 helix-turn-helix domain-containing protein [Candidatus Latescibacterota bacterium]